MKESIRELRKICQDPKKETGSKFCNLWYRPITIYLTKLFLYTPITANQVTMLSILSGVFGGFFLILSDNLFDIIGILLLQFYWLLDHVDGEIARYRKSGSLTGEYIDFAAHYMVYTIFLMGMTFGAYKDIGQIWVFVFGFSATTSVVLQKNIEAVIYWVICNERKNRLKKGIAEKKHKLLLSENKELLNEEMVNLDLKNRVKNYVKNALRDFPRLKVCLYTLIFLLKGGICSEMGIILTVFFPAIADIIWGGIDIAGNSYRFMTLYLILLGALYPILLMIKTTENIVHTVPDKEYKELFG